LKEQRAITYQALEEHWMCVFHTKTSQKAYCYPDPVKDGYCRPLTKGNLGYWAMLHMSLVCCCTRTLISDIDNFIHRCWIPKPIQSMSSHMRSISWQILLLAICRKALSLSSQQLRNKCRWPPDTGSMSGSQLSFHFHLVASFLQYLPQHLGINPHLWLAEQCSAHMEYR
jgi:hypothetical protein